MTTAATLAHPTAVLLIAAAVTAVATGAGQSRTFDGDPAGRPPAGFAFHVVRQASPARWSVEREGANGFLAHRGDASGHTGFALAILDGGSPGNVTVSARIRLAGGQRSAGLVWRVHDADNYYLARLDLDRQDIGLYRVVGGTRTRIEGEDDLELDTDAWHTLRIVHEDENIRVYLGGIRVLRARDRTLAQSGAAGVWCAGDAIAHFDDLMVAGAGDRNGDRDGKNEDSHRGR
jgi:hypothetical protein